METLNLKCEGMDLHNEILRNKDTIKRWEQTHTVLEDQLPERINRILCTGQRNGFDWKMCNYFDAEYLWTGNDLNNAWAYGVKHGIDYIFSFEVIEHLMNPLLFLEQLRKFNIPVVLTYPKHPFTPFWGPRHFHEYSTIAFHTLLHEAGFKAQYYTSFTNRNGWWKFPKTLKKLISRILLIIGYPKTELYILNPIGGK